MKIVIAFIGGVYVGQEYLGIPRLKPIMIKLWNDMEQKVAEYTKEDKK